MKTSKIALVTGGGRGIGKQIALVLAKNGYDISLSYNTSKEGANGTVDEIINIGQKAIAVQGDIKEIRNIEKIIKKTLNKFGKIDLLVNNAGITKGAKLLDITEELWEEISLTDWKAPLFFTQKVAKIMIDKQIKGSIINITSNQQQANFSGQSVYGSTKAALLKFTKHAALELSEHGIRVNAVAPGYTDIHTKGMKMMEPFALPRIPLNRYAKCEEIGHVVNFLASDKAEYITGTCILVDGGSVLPMYSDKGYYERVNNKGEGK